MEQKCTACTCYSGKWECVEQANCRGWAAISTYGHVQTFDDVHYELKGNCDYIFMLHLEHHFYLSIYIEACSTDGNTYCLKSFKFRVAINLNHLKYILMFIVCY